MPRSSKVVDRPVRRRLLQLAGVVAGCAAFVGSVAVFANGMRAAVNKLERPGLRLADCDVTPPAALRRDEFLAEVRRAAGLPEPLSAFTPDAVRDVGEAFSRHPWVERVVRVEARRASGLRAELVFRQPVLEVRAAGVTPGQEAWLVDGSGVVLPPNGYRKPLPLLLLQKLPHQPAGTVCADGVVSAAARTCAFLQSAQERLKLAVVESSRDGLTLKTAAGSSVIWGHAPGDETAGEAPARSKLERLLYYCETHGDLDRPTGRAEHDVRDQAFGSHASLRTGL